MQIECHSEKQRKIGEKRTNQKLRFGCLQNRVECVERLSCDATNTTVIQKDRTEEVSAMHKTCKCGFMMSDTTVPNHTVLWVFDEPDSSSHSFTFYHCECCHRLYKFPSKVDNRYYMLALREVLPSFPESAEYNYSTVYIQNDYDEEFKGYLAHDKRKLLLEYHGKTALFLAEEIYDGDQIIYHDQAPERIIFDPASIDRSVTTKHIRCSCGWMIAQEYGDCESFIDLYDEASWKKKVQYELCDDEELDDFDLRKRGLCCEKCRRLMLPDEHGKYIVYAPMTESIDKDSVFSFLYYSIYPLDVYSIEFDEYRECNEVPSELNKIFISEDKKYLRVHIGDTVVYYQAEKDE